MTSRSEPIVLIGPMGAGKSSVGRRVAKLLGVGFYDTDTAVVREHGPIADIFARDGEQRFRELEREAVRRGLEAGGVVSLGGGAVMQPATREAIAGARVVLLTVDERAIAKRIRGRKRPLLNGAADPVAEWARIMNQRLPVYRQVADAEFDTSRVPIQRVVERIAAWAREEESV